MEFVVTSQFDEHNSTTPYWEWRLDCTLLEFLEAVLRYPQDWSLDEVLVNSPHALSNTLVMRHEFSVLFAFPSAFVLLRSRIGCFN